MGDCASWSERRRAVRVPVRGVAVFRDGATRRATIENLSTTGALLDVMGVFSDGEIELKLGTGSGRVKARTVRVERDTRRTLVGIVFDDIDPELRETIEAAIADAITASQRRPVLVLDEDRARRTRLVRALAAEGMTPLAPATPLEAIELLTRTQLHVCVCMLAPMFGHSTSELRALVADSFPWVWTAEISDDLDVTVARANRAWCGTDVARFARAIA